MKKYCTAINRTMILMLIHFSTPITAMNSDGWQEVFTNDELRNEFVAKKFFLLEATIKKDSTTTEKILSASRYKVRLALANQMHQNMQYSDLNAYHKVTDPTTAPFFTTIYPFFQQLPEQIRYDLDCVTPLIVATFLNDRSTIAILIKYRAQINAAFGRCGYAPIHIATKYCPEIIPFLIDNGAGVDCRTASGDTPLMLACQKDGKFEALEPLITAHASFRAKTDLSVTPFGEYKVKLTALQIACDHQQREKVRLLLERGAPVDDPDEKGRTALHRTVGHSQFDIAELLLEQGADIMRTTEEGETVIEQISNSSDSVQAIELLRYGAPYPRKASYRAMIEKEISQGHCFYKAEFVKAFVQALIQNEVEQIKKLISSASGTLLNDTDSKGMGPLHWAVCRGNTQAASLLLSKIQPINGKTFANKLPLLSGYTLQPFNINQKDAKSRTPLTLAQRLRRTEIEQLLLQAGAQ